MPAEREEQARQNAVTLIKAAISGGVTPKREHLVTVYGEEMAAEMLSLIAQKRAEEGRRIAAAVARRNGESIAAAKPKGESVEDLLTKIIKAMPAEIPKNEPEQPPAPLDAKAAANEVFGPRGAEFKRTTNGKPGHEYGPVKTYGSQPLYERGTAPRSEQR